MDMERFGEVGLENKRNEHGFGEDVVRDSVPESRRKKKTERKEPRLACYSTARSISGHVAGKE